ncbi:hypothetical protein [Lederbergia lenta]|uniref:Uncharacterized protein n=1 Tax=Lederbergia lenta TaxID=1467 RepID=A0A2X4WEW2_LEDLE|nr:hypothetical protein [Lederbergia lenta]MEC2323068.1 hypothetical protein [Lederbergia lenta]SQI62626.1 Uncharacterised protein [Lederbergia lenta]
MSFLERGTLDSVTFIKEMEPIKDLNLNQEQLKQVLHVAYDKGYDEDTSLNELLYEMTELLESFVNVQAR